MFANRFPTRTEVAATQKVARSILPKSDEWTRLTRLVIVHHCRKVPRRNQSDYD